MLDAIKNFFGTLMDWIFSCFEWIWDALVNVWDEVVGFLEDLWSNTQEWLVGQLPASMSEWFTSNEVIPSALAGTVRLVSYFIPVRTIGLMVLSVFAVTAVIRLLRWVKAFIPSISG